MNNIEKQLNNEILHEKDFKSALSVIKVQFDKFIHSEKLKSSNYDSSAREARIEHRMLVREKKTILGLYQTKEGLENQRNTSGDESSGSRNECNEKCTSGDDTKIRPSYDTEPMVEQPESISNTCVVIPDSSDMCDNDIQTDQNVVECDDERVVLADLIANLKLDVDENKKIQKQLKKANTALAHELKECKSILAETSRTL
ncbi:hypothetical protein Tco_0779260, partial [Tanacetum coccineum]